jgi:tRNA pseudouridine55 synthase
LLLLSGRATKLSGSFLGLDKRYVTTVDLTAQTTTGDREGDRLQAHAPPSADELEQRLAALRGEVALPIPAASAVKIDGERAYRLHRRGVAVEMPVRRSTIYELRLSAFDGESAVLELHVSSGTYVRSVAEALGGHCRELRRTAIGPFSVEEADWERIVPTDEAVARLPQAAGRA